MNNHMPPKLDYLDEMDKFLEQNPFLKNLLNW